MNILALESSAVTASVAILSDGRIVGEESYTNGLTHSQTLMPMVDEVLCRAGLKLADIDRFAVTNGPGSFTGLRIGIGTAKGLAYGCGKKVVGVSTLEALAYNIAPSPFLLAPIMDARRGEVYNALYRMEGDTLTTITPPRALPVTALAEEIAEPVLFVGDGVAVHREALRAQLGELSHFAPPHLCLQRAASAAVLAQTMEPLDAQDLTVVYLRKPQVEREREARMKG